MPYYKVEVVKYITGNVDQINTYRVRLPPYWDDVSKVTERIIDELEGSTGIFKVKDYHIKSIEVDNT